MTQIGVIGLGHWGPNHVRTFNLISDSRVTAVADTDAVRRERMKGSKFRVYESAEALVRSKEVDAIIVCTPTTTHYKIVRDALEAGKHVLCEKPLCTNSTEGQILVEIAADKKLILMVGHVFLFNPGLLKVKELLGSDQIGEIRYLSSTRTNLGPIRNDINAGWDLASHDIAVFNWLLGSLPIDIQAMGACFIRPSIEDVVNINLRYPRNVLASIQCSWLDPKKVRQMTIVGSKRMVTWDDLALSNPVAIYEKGVQSEVEIGSYGEFLRVSMLDGDVHLPKIPAEEPLRNQALAFLQAINEGRPPICDGAFGNQVVQILELLENKLKVHRKATPPAIFIS